MKKISLTAAVTAVVLALLVGCAVTFQVTKIADRNQYAARRLQDAAAAQSAAETSQNEPITTEPGLIMTNEGSFLNKLLEKVSEVDDIYRSSYIGELDDDQLIDYMLDGYIDGTGDRFGAYYNAEEFQAFMDDLEGELTGIGVNVIYDNATSGLEIISVVPDSPAMEAGIQPGDIIIEVGEEHESTENLGYYPTIARLRGGEGTHAVFTIARVGDEIEYIDYDLIRRKITETTVMCHVYEPDPTVGYIKITGFDGGTCDQFVKAVESMQGSGCTRLVIDLRYNPGGELNSIVTTLDYILPEGPIIRITDADGTELRVQYSDERELDMPMAVLVNGSTASAAELFTSAVRDYEKAIIVGTNTYGKGCMQSTIPLSDGSAVSVTNHLYNPPFSDNYQGIGIEPDVIIELDESLRDKNVYKITDWEDNQLSAAVAALNGAEADEAA